MTSVKERIAALQRGQANSSGQDTAPARQTPPVGSRAGAGGAGSSDHASRSQVSGGSGAAGAVASRFGGSSSQESSIDSRAPSEARSPKAGLERQSSGGSVAELARRFGTQGSQSSGEMAAPAPAKAPTPGPTPALTRSSSSESTSRATASSAVGGRLRGTAGQVSDTASPSPKQVRSSEAGLERQSSSGSVAELARRFTSQNSQSSGDDSATASAGAAQETSSSRVAELRRQLSQRSQSPTNESSASLLSRSSSNSSTSSAEAGQSGKVAALKSKLGGSNLRLPLPGLAPSSFGKRAMTPPSAPDGEDDDEKPEPVSGVGKEDDSQEEDQDEEEEDGDGQEVAAAGGGKTMGSARAGRGGGIGDGEGASAGASTRDSQYDSDCRSSQSGSFKHDVLERPKIARSRRRPTSFKTLAITALAASKDGSFSSITTASVMAGRSSSFVARPSRDGAPLAQKSKLSRPATTFSLRDSRDEIGDESVHASDGAGDQAQRRDSEAWKSDEEEYEDLGHASEGLESKGQALKEYGAQRSTSAASESDGELSDGEEDDDEDNQDGQDLMRRHDRNYDDLAHDDVREAHDVDDEESDSNDDDDVGQAGKAVNKSHDEDLRSDDSLTDDEDLI